MSPTSPSPAGARLLSKQEHEDMEAIDAAIERMRTFTPPDPYVLTIPQDEPRYHHSWQYQTRQWLHNTPFDPAEHESSQYQTFIYHEPGRSMYQQHNSRVPDGSSSSRQNGGDSFGKEKAGTGANTPAPAPKKTISLSAYKKKQAGATPDAAAAKDVELPQQLQQSKKPAVKGPVERLKADEEVLAAVEDAEDILPVVEEKKDLKRKRGDSVVNEEAASHRQQQREQQQEDIAVEEEHTTKKARRESPPPKADGKKVDAESELPEQPAEPAKSPEKPQEDAPASDEDAPASDDDVVLPPKLSPPPPASEEMDLPPKLSPPPKQSPTAVPKLPPIEAPEELDLRDLPPRLSPTVPTNIADALNTRSHARSVSRSSEVSGPRSASKDASLRPFTPPPKKIPSNGFRANSNSPAAPSDNDDRGRRPVSSLPPLPKEQPVETTDDEIPVGKRAEHVKRQRESIADQESLIVTIKLKKASRESAKRILKLKPGSSKTLLPALGDTADKSTDEEKVATRPRKGSDARQRQRRDTNAKGVAQKVGPATAANGVTKKEKESPLQRKRSRPEETDDSDDYPPKKRANTAELKKQQTSTPTPSDLLSPSSAQRQTAHATPGAMKKGKDVLSEAMKRERSHDSNLATPPATLLDSPMVNGASANGTAKPSPSSNPPSIKTAKQREWEAEQKRLDALGRELKHAATNSLNKAKTDPATASREGKLAAIQSLESLLAYILAFTSADEAAAAASPPLNSSIKLWRSLNGFFGFVKKYTADFPPLLGLACWLGVVFYAQIMQLATKQASDAGGLTRDSLLETQAMMLRAASEAEAKLDVDALQAAFPRTWAGRSKSVLEAEKLEAGQGFAGAYKLPLGLQTSPLKAARAGYAMLEEWVKEQGGAEFYGFKLRL